MLADQNEFFREMTLRICSHLEIEKAMQACMEYLTHYIPADTMYLDLFEQDHSVMRVVAKATRDSCERVDWVVPLPKEAVKAIAETKSPKPLIINRIREHPVAAPMNIEAGDTDCSNLVIQLASGKRPLGAVAFVKEGCDVYDQEHADLLASLNEPFAIAVTNCMQHDEVIRLSSLLENDTRELFRDIHQLTGDRIIGANFGLAKVMERVRQVAAHDSPVLLLGDTGVGKDVIASAIHYSSSRRNGPFIKVNSGAIPDSLVDSELFGHEKGAFTGAITQKRGRFERADRGTLFLDEIGDLPPAAQVRLLRVLQNNEIERVGGTDMIPVDVRVIAATHRQLNEMVEEGRFREDLWYRLNVFPVQIPPLKSRIDDIPALAHHFIERLSERMRLPASPKLGPGTLERLKAYSWPGNVRELENVIERALILKPQGPLDIYPSGKDLPVPATTKSNQASGPSTIDTSRTLDEVVSEYIRAVLDSTEGKIHGPHGAAAILELNANTLRYRMDKLGISYKKKDRV